MFIQEMKYVLVQRADGKVFLGDYLSLVDEDGKIDDKMAVSTKDNIKI